MASLASAAEEFQFNTDILDLKDQQNLDLGLFSKANFILPGQYNLVVHVNRDSLPETSVDYIAPEDDPKGSVACISPALVAELGLKKQRMNQLAWWHQGNCLDISSIPGMTVRGDLGASALYLNIPQDALEYTASNWDPPSRWTRALADFCLTTTSMPRPWITPDLRPATSS